MKTVSQLDPSGYFIGAVQAHESPLEPGVYLIPGGAVDAPLPTVPSAHRAKWVGEWVMEPLPPGPARPLLVEKFEPAEQPAVGLVPKPDRVGTEPPPEQLPVDPGPSAPKQLSSIEYLDLFTAAEEVAIIESTNADVKRLYYRAVAATFVTLGDPRTETGLNFLVSEGLLTATRKAEIMEAME